MQTAEIQQPSPQRKPGRSFNSLAFAKRLQAGGAFTREQAEMLAEEQAALIDDRLATKEDIEALRLSTKSDIEALRLSTKSDIEALRLSTKTDIERTRAEIIKWMFGTVATQTIILLAAMIGILHGFH